MATASGVTVATPQHHRGSLRVSNNRCEVYQVLGDSSSGYYPRVVNVLACVMDEITEVELTIWITPLLDSWLRSQAARNQRSRHRIAENILEQTMHATLQREQDATKSEDSPNESPDATNES